jgi:hypothetical protein
MKYTFYILGYLIAFAFGTTFPPELSGLVAAFAVILTILTVLLMLIVAAAERGFDLQREERENELKTILGDLSTEMEVTPEKPKEQPVEGSPDFESVEKDRIEKLKQRATQRETSFEIN